MTNWRKNNLRATPSTICPTLTEPGLNLRLFDDFPAIRLLVAWQRAVRTAQTGKIGGSGTLRFAAEMTE